MDAVAFGAAAVAAGIALAGANTICISYTMAARYVAVSVHMIIHFSIGNHVLDPASCMSCTNTSEFFCSITSKMSIVYGIVMQPQPYPSDCCGALHAITLSMEAL
jgi:hypothetical protein